MEYRVQNVGVLIAAVALAGCSGERSGDDSTEAVRIIDVPAGAYHGQTSSGFQRAAPSAETPERNL
jgi:hypothetical protein